MFDFPTSPATGTISNGYQWDGEKWLGGSGAATPVTEQHFDVSGLVTLNIPIPSWAKAAQLIGSCFVGVAGGYVTLRVSDDGTTFKAGASDYAATGPIHFSGSTGYA